MLGRLCRCALRTRQKMPRLNAFRYAHNLEKFAAGFDTSKPGFDEMALNPKVEEALNYILELNMMEIAQLTQAIQIQYSLPDVSLGIGGGASAGDGNADEASKEVKEEKTSFDLKLSSYDAKSKIKVIKEIRSITGLGLKEAKELVEKAPSTVKKDVKKDEAEALIAKLKELGAVLEME